jgi:hypothetical protein
MRRLDRLGKFAGVIQLLIIGLSLLTAPSAEDLQIYHLGKVKTKVQMTQGKAYLSLNTTALLLDSTIIEAILARGLKHSGALKRINKALYVENRFLESQFGIGFRVDHRAKRIYPSPRLRASNFQGIPVRATSFEAQRIASPGHRGDYKMNDYDVAAALPSRKYLGRSVFVYYPKTGKSVVAPITDVGPWNTKDPWLLKGHRPKAEKGRDDRGRQTNLAGIDLSFGAWEALGIPWTRVIKGNVSDYVEIHLLD